jgi:ubiquitin-protein ligase E3 D
MSIMEDPAPSDDQRPDRQSAQIHLYAEHLQNIRTLSIQASLATAPNKETKATLSADGSLLSLSHEGETANIRLPLSIGQHSDATLTLPAAPTKDLTFRLNIEEKPGADSALGNGASSSENTIPWMAGDLTPDTEISCAKCHWIFVHRGRITQWKDLPSEGWAEMMDFWHCHKPDEGLAHGAENAGRGVSANSKLAVEPGVGLVGSTDFLFHSRDCAVNVSHDILSLP